MTENSHTQIIFKKMINILKIDLLFLFFLAILAFLLRIYLLKYSPIIQWDNAYFISLGKEFIKGNPSRVFHGYWEPFYPFMIGIFSLFLKDMELSGKIVSAVMGSVLIFPVFSLAKNIFNKKIAFYSAIFIIFHPSLLLCSIDVMMESTYTFFIISGIWINYIAIKTCRIFYFLLAGLLFGVAYLTRAEALAYAVIVPLINIALQLKTLRPKKRELIYNFYLFALFFSCVAIYVSFYYSKTGALTLSTKTESNLQIMLDKDFSIVWGIPEDLKDDTLGDSAYKYGRRIPLPGGRITFIRSHYKEMLYRYLENIYKEYTIVLPRVISPFIILLGFLGLFRSGWEIQNYKNYIYLTTFLLIPLFFYPAFFVWDRLFIVSIPIFVILAMEGISGLGYWLNLTYQNLTQKPFLQKYQLRFELCIVLIIVISLMPEVLKLRVKGQFDERKQVAIWMKNNLPHKIITMSLDQAIEYYRGGNPLETHITIPSANFEEITEYARYHKADYLIIDEYLITNVRPQLHFLLNEEKVPSNLKLIYKFEMKKGHKVLVYQFIWDQKARITN